MSPPDQDALDPADQELVTRSQAATVLPSGVLVTRHERRVFNVAYRMLGRHRTRPGRHARGVILPVSASVLLRVMPRSPRGSPITVNAC